MKISEKRIIALVGAIMFVNTLDFVMVMPLGPDFAKGLGISKAHLGYIGGSYTAAAALSGLISALFLDRFDRKKAVILAMLGLSIGTFAGAFATGFGTLVLARIVAGLFGGPAASVGMSIISDVIPPERRGRAMGAVMGAFSISSIIGVPAGLEAARLFGWRSPFLGVGAACLLVIALIFIQLPSLKGHITHQQEFNPLKGMGELWRLVRVRKSFVMMAVAMFSSFLLIPNFASYTQYNAGYPREKLGMLYMIGGAVTFFTMRLAGKLMDIYGAYRLLLFLSAFLCLDLFLGYTFDAPLIPVPFVFVCFMIPQSARNVTLNALCSKVPSSHQRAAYQSLQSSVTHLAISLGSFAGSVILIEGADGKMQRMWLLSSIVMCCTLIVPFIAKSLERSLRA